MRHPIKERAINFDDTLEMQQAQETKKTTSNQVEELQIQIEEFGFEIEELQKELLGVYRALFRDFPTNVHRNY